MTKALETTASEGLGNSRIGLDREATAGGNDSQTDVTGQGWLRALIFKHLARLMSDDGANAEDVDEIKERWVNELDKLILQLSHLITCDRDSSRLGDLIHDVTMFTIVVKASRTHSLVTAKEAKSAMDHMKVPRLKLLYSFLNDDSFGAEISASASLMMHKTKQYEVGERELDIGLNSLRDASSPRVLKMAAHETIDAEAMLVITNCKQLEDNDNILIMLEESKASVEESICLLSKARCEELHASYNSWLAMAIQV